MSRAEMNRRLRQMTVGQRERIRSLIVEGWGAQSIKIETGIPLRLVNAVFQYWETR